MGQLNVRRSATTSILISRLKTLNVLDIDRKRIEV